MLYRNSTSAAFGRSIAISLKAGASLAALCLAGTALPALAQTAAGDVEQSTNTPGTKPGPSNTDNVQEETDPAAGPDIVVTGFRQSLSSAQGIKRNSDVIVDSVTAEDIGALPDRSVTETLQRIPGVSINRFAAGVDPDHFSVEGSGVVVRGLTYVRSEFNGRDAFSAGNSGGLSFSDVPSELLGGVDVFKSPSADRIEGGIAGVVNLRTRKPFDQKGLLLSANAEMNYGEFAKKGAPSLSALVSNRWETGIGEFGLLGSISYSQLYTRADRLGISSFRVRPLYSNGTRTDVVPFTGATRQGSGLFPRGAVAGSQDFNRERYGYSAAAQWRSNDGSMEATAQFLRSDARQTWDERTVEIATDNVTANGDSRARTGTTLNFDDSGLFENGIITGPTGWRADQNTAGDRRTPEYGLQSNNISRQQVSKIVTSDYSFNFKWDVTSRLGLNLDYQHVDSSSKIDDNGLWTSTYQDAQIRMNGSKIPDVQFLSPQNCNGICTGTPGAASTYSGYFGPGRQSYLDPYNSFYRSAMDHREESTGNSDAVRLDLEYSFPETGFLRAIRAGGRFAQRETEARFSAYNWGVLSEQWGNGGPVWLSDNVDGSPTTNGGTPPQGYQPVLFDNFLQGRTASPFGPGRLFYSGMTAANVAEYRAYASRINQEWQARITCANGNGRTVNGGWNPLSERCDVIPGSTYLPGEINPQTERNRAGYVMARFDTEFGNGWKLNGNVGVRYTNTQRISQGFQSFPTVTSLPTTAQCATQVQQVVTGVAGASLSPFCALTTAQQTSYRGFLNGATVANNVDITYDYWLPSLNVKLEVGNGIQFRGAYTKGVAPPSPGLVRNYYVVALTTQARVNGAGQQIPIVVNADGSIPANQVQVLGQFNAGNPYLLPTEADSFDLTGEWYFSRVGSITVSGFYKRLTNVLTNDTQRTSFTNNGQTFEAIVTTPVNSDDVGHIRGVEVGYQQTYDFLPGFLKGLGLQANYTFISSSGVPQATLSATDPAVAAGQQPTITGNNFPLQGLSKHQFNVTPFIDVGPLSLRASYNWRSDYLLTLRDVITPFDPIFQRAYGQMDASAFVQVTPQFRIGVQGVNLTNSMTVTEAAVVDQNQAIRRVPRQWYVNDRRYSIVARMNF
ncbi:hypothetical protein ASG37_05330 [Sphingomonas sp. Leaf407]|uniref:TonB-dependent receptor n=1 Tax=unclassified Sphingomonas TaxID=196159 RepID=UPI0006F72C3A|nr:MULTISPECIES: TonB-dependent receptor [unclassified Sphingomonas]KQN37074.1 hypothetical protein ASE97_11245 [Sphingomonas sp. Leaf42]KQT30501.1 hypothetical protein ASG37_05330 [Sphingomonas sp. Leaf407]